METLTQYLTYNLNNNNIGNLKNILLLLDKQLEIYHRKGVNVDVNPATIIYSDGDFIFSSIKPGVNDEDINKGIVDLAKLAVGIYNSIPSGQFVDYTRIPTQYLKEHFDELKLDSCIPKDDDDSYYRDTIVDGSEGVYYNNYLVSLVDSRNRSDSRSNSNTATVVKSLGTIGKPNTVREEPIQTAQILDFDSSKRNNGNAVSNWKNKGNSNGSNKQAAFIDIVFYPILLSVFLMVGYAISVILRIL